MSGLTPSRRVIEPFNAIGEACGAVTLAVALAAGLGSTPLPAETGNTSSKIVADRAATTNDLNDFGDLVRLGQFVDLHKAIDRLASIPEDEDYHIADTVKTDGQHVVSLLFLFGLPTPKVFSHDAESVSFNWARGDERYYLTVSDGSASLLRTTSSDNTILAHALLRDEGITDVLKTTGMHVGQTGRA